MYEFIYALQHCLLLVFLHKSNQDCTKPNILGQLLTLSFRFPLYHNIKGLKTPLLDPERLCRFFVRLVVRFCQLMLQQLCSVSPFPTPWGLVLNRQFLAWTYVHTSIAKTCQ